MLMRKIALINISIVLMTSFKKEALHVSKKSIATLKSSVKQMDEFDQKSNEKYTHI